MFGDDEAPFTFQSMREFSTVDGFVEITESLAEMIKFLANEPSVGLFYVQQHTQSAVPNLINLNNNVAEKSRDMSLHTEDSEDSILTVRSMKECGYPIASEMINDINKSLAIISTKQQKKGLLSNSRSFGFQMGNTTSWGPSSWGRSDGEGTSTYFSSVFKKASNFTWAQVDIKEPSQAKNEKIVSYAKPPLAQVDIKEPSQAKNEKIVSYAKPPLELSSVSTSETTMEMESDELPLSSPTAGKIQEEDEVQVKKSLSSDKLLVISESFDEIRAEKEAKLEEWLGGGER